MEQKQKKKLTNNAKKSLQKEMDAYQRFILNKSEFFSDLNDSAVINESHIQMAAEEFNTGFFANKRILEKKKNDYISYMSISIALIGMMISVFSMILLFSEFEISQDHFPIELIALFSTFCCTAIVIVFYNRKKDTSDNEKRLNKFLNKWDDLESKLKLYYEKQYDSSPRSIKELFLFFVELPGIQTQKGMEETFFSLLEKRNKIVHQRISKNEIKSIDKSLDDVNLVISMLTAVSYLKKGIDYSENGDTQKALYEFNRTIEYKPDFVAAYFYRGNVYGTIKEYERALADFNKAIILNPDFPEVYINRGRIFTEISDTDRAIADFEKALELGFDTAETYNNRGFAYVSRGDYDRAISDYSKAIQLMPNDAQLYINRGLCFQKMEDPIKALVDFTTGLEVARQNGDTKMIQICENKVKEMKENSTVLDVNSKNYS